MKPRKVVMVAAVIFFGFAAALYCAVVIASHVTRNDPVSVTRQQVTGTWVSEDSGELVFSKGNRFTTPGLKLTHSVSDCDPGPASGEWLFYSDGEDGVGDESKDSGPVVGLMFDGQESSCLFDLDAHKAKGKIVLCVTTDPDEECGGEVYFTKAG